MIYPKTNLFPRLLSYLEGFHYTTLTSKKQTGRPGTILSLTFFLRMKKKLFTISEAGKFPGPIRKELSFLKSKKEFTEMSDTDVILKEKLAGK